MAATQSEVERRKSKLKSGLNTWVITNVDDSLLFDRFEFSLDLIFYVNILTAVLLQRYFGGTKGSRLRVGSTPCSLTGLMCSIKSGKQSI